MSSTFNKSRYVFIGVIHLSNYVDEFERNKLSGMFSLRLIVVHKPINIAFSVLVSSA